MHRPCVIEAPAPFGVKPVFGFREWDFINRENGHYIINLDQEVTGASQNEGYINNIYISPPGDINMITGALDTSTYYTVSPTVTTYGDLLNMSLQMHAMFRIVIREDESRSILHPHNI